MAETQIINPGHVDIVHNVEFDYYGERMAMCSSDQYVKVWDKDEQGLWTLTASWKAHGASVWKVTWADPEFGQVLATCSFDHTASIWEESSISGENKTSLWELKVNLIDSSLSVTDVKFGPRSFGFTLATCSADGVTRIYEVSDEMNTCRWPMTHQVSLTLPNSCLTWNPLVSASKYAMLAVGSDDKFNNKSSKVFICEYDYKCGQWAKTKSIASVKHPVHDIKFAPSMGRSFHLLAVATNNIRIFILKPLTDAGSAFGYAIETAAQFDDHLCPVSSVDWNVTGTALATSGKDGRVRLWKSDVNIWKCVGVLKHDEVLTKPPTKTTKATTPQSNLTRFFKLGKITHPSEVHWH